MQQSRMVEIWVGLFVLLGVVSLFFLAMKVSNLADLQVKDDSYRLLARFQNAGSLKVRSPVSMAGVRIGRVSAIGFDNKTYEAVVEMRIEPQYNKIPADTTANILTAGLLGEQYVGLSAGGEEDYLKDGDTIELSQSALVLEEVISRFLFNKAESGAEKKAEPTSEAPPAPAVEPASEPEPGVAEEPPKPKPAAKPAAAKPKPASQPKPDKADAETARKAKPAKPAEDSRNAQSKSKTSPSKKSSEDKDDEHKAKAAPH